MRGWASGAALIAALCIGAALPPHAAAYEWPGKRARVLAKLASASPADRAKGARELAYFRAADVLPHALKALDDDATEVRIAALDALVALDARDAAAPIARLLAAPEPELRRAAVEALAQLGAKAQVEPLARALGDPAPEVRREAVRALGELGFREGQPAVASALADADPEVVQVAMEVLAESGDRGALFALLERAHDPSYSIRAGAIKALGRLGEAQAVGPLVSALNDPHPDVQSAAVDGLAALGDARATEPLVRALWSHHTTPLGRRIVVALGRLGDPSAAPALIQAMRYSDPAGPLAADALKRLGPAAVPPVLRALQQSASPSFQRRCLEVLHYAAQHHAPDGRDAARDALVRALLPELLRARYPQDAVARTLLATEDPRVLGPALQLLAELAPPPQDDAPLDEEAAAHVQLRRVLLEGIDSVLDARAVEPLKALYPSASDDERALILRALGRVGAPEALALLREALRDGDAYQRKVAVEALAHIDGPASGLLMVELMRAATPHDMVELGVGLGSNTAPEVGRALLALAQTSRGPVRLAALQALSDHVRRAPWPEALDALEAWASAPEPDVAARALDALGSAQHSLRAAWVALAQARYDDGGPALRRKAIEVLGDWRADAASATLVRAARDRSPEVRAEAALALGHTPRVDARDALVALLDDPHDAVRINAAAALALRPNDDAREALERALARARGPARANLILALAQRDAAPSTPALARMARRSAQPAVREAIARVLAKRDTDPARAMLRALLQHAEGDPDLRDVIEALIDPRPQPAGEPWIRYVFTDQGARMADQRVIVTRPDGLNIAKVSDDAGEVRLEHLPTQGACRMVALDEVFRRSR